MRVSWRWRGLGWFLVASACLLGGAAALAADDEVELLAQLVWATEGTKPAGKELKELDAATRDKLRGVFRWKEYLEIGQKDFKVSSAALTRVRLSPKCEIEVERLGKEVYQVKLFGEGKMVVKKRQSLKPAELLVLAGDDKNDTAWFVVIRLKTNDE